VVLTDHKAITSVMSGREFDTDRLNRLSAEIMEYDLHVCYRPGKLLTIADLMSRAKIEQDPQAKRQMALELVAWQAQQEIDTAEQNEENEKNHQEAESR